MKVRIQFSKHGVVKYIGHLDVMRYFQKALRRADIPVKYTGGFSPHQVISFAQPLGVGVESESEYFDMELDREDDLQAMKERLNASMADAKNAMASIAAASYEVRFREGMEPAFDLSAEIEALLKQSTIPYVKQTKKNEIEVDLKQGIYTLSAEKDKKDHWIIYMTVDASSGGNIKPSTILEVLYKRAGDILPPFALAITRMEIFAKNDSGHLMPLIQAN